MKWWYVGCMGGRVDSEAGVCMGGVDSEAGVAVWGG